MRVHHWLRGWICGAAIVVGVFVGAALGQQAEASAAATTPTSVAGELRSLASRAGVVFVGQVQSIEPEGGVVEVKFLVQQTVLGSVGATYTMREWAGRWTGGQQRYRVGQRAMFFLHAPSAAGLSSPVDGMSGVVPLIPTGANAAAMLDDRWLATRVERALGSPMVSGAITLADAMKVVSGGQQMTLPEPVMYAMPEGVRPRPVSEPLRPIDMVTRPVVGSGANSVAGPGVERNPLRIQEALDAER